MRSFVYFVVIMFAVALLSCSKQSPPPQSVQPSAQAIHISAPPPGAEPYLFMLMLTNSQPPAMRSAIAITKTMKYEWHKIAEDGTQSTARGIVPTEICDGVMAEWKSMSGRTSVDPTREQAVYIGPVGGPHPPQVQRLLDYLSK